MAKEKQILVYKNSYWLSEIGALFFKYQVGYEVYDYSENASMVDDGIDLMVLNSQTYLQLSYVWVIHFLGKKYFFLF